MSLTFEQVVLLLAAAMAYTKIVTITLLILFKIGDPTNVAQLANLDNYAKSMGDLTKNLSLAVAKLAAVAGLSAVTGGVGAAKSLASKKAWDAVKNNEDFKNLEQQRQDLEEDDNMDAEEKAHRLQDIAKQKDNLLEAAKKDNPITGLDEAKNWIGLNRGEWANAAKTALATSATQTGQAATGLVSTFLPGGGAGLREVFNAGTEGAAQGKRMARTGVRQYIKDDWEASQAAYDQSELGKMQAAEAARQTDYSGQFRIAQDDAQRTAGQVRARARHLLGEVDPMLKELGEDGEGRSPTMLRAYENQALGAARAGTAEAFKASMITDGTTFNMAKAQAKSDADEAVAMAHELPNAKAKIKSKLEQLKTDNQGLYNARDQIEQDIKALENQIGREGLNPELEANLSAKRAQLNNNTEQLRQISNNAGLGGIIHGGEVDTMIARGQANAKIANALGAATEGVNVSFDEAIAVSQDSAYKAVADRKAKAAGLIEAGGAPTIGQYQAQARPQAIKAITDTKAQAAEFRDLTADQIRLNSVQDAKSAATAIIGRAQAFTEWENKFTQLNNARASGDSKRIKQLERDLGGMENIDQAYRSAALNQARTQLQGINSGAFRGENVSFDEGLAVQMYGERKGVAQATRMARAINKHGYTQADLNQNARVAAEEEIIGVQEQAKQNQRLGHDVIRRNVAEDARAQVDQKRGRAQELNRLDKVGASIDYESQAGWSTRQQYGSGQAAKVMQQRVTAQNVALSSIVGAANQAAKINEAALTYNAGRDTMVSEFLRSQVTENENDSKEVAKNKAKLRNKILKSHAKAVKNYHGSDEGKALYQERLLVKLETGDEETEKRINKSAKDGMRTKRAQSTIEDRLNEFEQGRSFKKERNQKAVELANQQMEKQAKRAGIDVADYVEQNRSEYAQAIRAQRANSGIRDEIISQKREAIEHEVLRDEKMRAIERAVHEGDKKAGFIAEYARGEVQNAAEYAVIEKVALEEARAHRVGDTKNVKHMGEVLNSEDGKKAVNASGEQFIARVSSPDEDAAYGEAFKMFHDKDINKKVSYNSTADQVFDYKAHTLQKMKAHADWEYSSASSSVKRTNAVIARHALTRDWDQKVKMGAMEKIAGYAKTEFQGLIQDSSRARRMDINTVFEREARVKDDVVLQAKRNQTFEQARKEAEMTIVQSAKVEMNMPSAHTTDLAPHKSQKDISGKRFDVKLDPPMIEGLTEGYKALKNTGMDEPEALRWSQMVQDKINRVAYRQGRVKDMYKVLYDEETSEGSRVGVEQVLDRKIVEAAFKEIEGGQETFEKMKRGGYFREYNGSRSELKGSFIVNNKCKTEREIEKAIANDVRANARQSAPSNAQNNQTPPAGYQTRPGEVVTAGGIILNAARIAREGNG